MSPVASLRGNASLIGIVALRPGQGVQSGPSNGRHSSLHDNGSSRYRPINNGVESEDSRPQSPFTSTRTFCNSPWLLPSRLGLPTRAAGRRSLRTSFSNTPHRTRRLLFQSGSCIVGRRCGHGPIRNLQPPPHPARLRNIHSARVQGQGPWELPIPTVHLSPNLGHLRNTPHSRICWPHCNNRL